MNFTQGIQSSSPIDSFVRVLPAPMPGYPFDEVMASGSFTQGSTIELSADAPVKNLILYICKVVYQLNMGNFPSYLP